MLRKMFAVAVTSWASGFSRYPELFFLVAFVAIYWDSLSCLTLAVIDNYNGRRDRMRLKRDIHAAIGAWRALRAMEHYD